MKRKLLVLLTAVTSLSIMTGCSNKLDLYSNISAENSEITADYMACTVLKYQSTNKYKLLDDPIETTRLRSALNARAAEEAVILEEARNEKENAEKTENSSDNNDTNTDSKDEQNDVEDVDNSGIKQESTSSSIAQALGLDGIEINISSYNFYDRYSVDDIYLIEPDDGKKIMVVSFDISNVSEEQKQLSFADIASVSYKISMGEKVYLPLMTAIENDIMFLDALLEPGNKTDAVLVFQIDKDCDESSISLSTSSDKGSIVSQIK